MALTILRGLLWTAIPLVSLSYYASAAPLESPLPFSFVLAIDNVFSRALSGLILHTLDTLYSPKP